MAEKYLNSAERVSIYDALSRLNRSFSNIVRNLYDLDETRIFSSRRLRELRGAANEMQCEINHYFTDNLEGIESRDWQHYGKVRIARDHRLNPARPALSKPRK